MRVINSCAGVRVDSMAEGETFIHNDSYWLITGFTNTNDDTLCANLSSGHTIFLPRDLIVVPVTAEVHIL